MKTKFLILMMIFFGLLHSSVFAFDHEPNANGHCSNDELIRLDSSNSFTGNGNLPKGDATDRFYIQSPDDGTLEINLTAQNNTIKFKAGDKCGSKSFTGRTRTKSFQVTKNQTVYLTVHRNSKKSDNHYQLKINFTSENNSSGDNNGNEDANNDIIPLYSIDFENNLDNKWRTLRAMGNFTPKVIETSSLFGFVHNKSLRLTDRQHDLSTAVTLDYEFPTKDNKFVLEFDYYAYGGCRDGENGKESDSRAGDWGADGMNIILYDTSVGATPGVGASGGSMGYANGNIEMTNGNYEEQSGFEKGWLGIGLDEFGAYGANNEGRRGTDGQTEDDEWEDGMTEPNSVVIRGSQNSGYRLLYKTRTDNIARELSSGTGLYFSGQYRLTVDSTQSDHLYITLERRESKSDNYTKIINHFDAMKSQYHQGSKPEKFRVAFSSGTGGGCNNHEIDNVKVYGKGNQYTVDTNDSQPHTCLASFPGAISSLQDPLDILSATVTGTINHQLTAPFIKQGVQNDVVCDNLPCSANGRVAARVQFSVDDKLGDSTKTKEGSVTLDGRQQQVQEYDKITGASNETINLKGDLTLHIKEKIAYSSNNTINITGGTVTIYTDTFSFNSGTKINIAPGSKLIVYANTFDFNSGSENGEYTPDQFVVYAKEKLEIDSGGTLKGLFYSDQDLNVRSGGTYAGAFTGATVDFNSNNNVHYDADAVRNYCAVQSGTTTDLSPEDCTKAPNDLLTFNQDFDFSKNNDVTGNGELGTVARYKNVATYNGEDLDLLVKVEDLKNMHSLYIGNSTPKGFKFQKINGTDPSVGFFIDQKRSDPKDTVYDATLRFTYVKHGTNEPVAVNFETQVYDIDNFANRTEKIVINKDDYKFFQLSEDSHIEGVRQGDEDSFTNTHDEDSQNFDPAASVKFVHEQKSTFTVHFQHIKNKSAGEYGGKAGFNLVFGKTESGLGSCEQKSETVVPTCYMMTDNKRAIYTVHPDPDATPLPSTSSKQISKLLTGEGSAYRAKDGLVYAFDGDDGSTENINLYAIDPASGVLSLVKENLFRGEVEAAEFYIDPSSGRETLFVLSKEHNTKLFAFNPQNNWKVLSGYPKNIDGDTTRLASLAIDPRTGNAYATLDYQYDHKPPKLYRLNLSTGQTEFLTNLGKNLDAEGLAFGSDNRIYAEDERDHRRLYAINLVDGSVVPAAILGGDGDFEAISCDGGREFYFLSVEDASLEEGNSGFKDMQFEVKLNKTANEDVHFTYSVLDETAKQGDDYFVDDSKTGVIPAGTDSALVTVKIKGDYQYEPDETFKVIITHTDLATIVDGNATGTILNDDTFMVNAWDIGNSASPSNPKIGTKIVNDNIVLNVGITSPVDSENIDVNATLAFGDDNQTISAVKMLHFTSNQKIEQVDFGRVTHAYKNAFILFTFQNDMNETVHTKSLDAFAIRPDHFAIALPQKLIAGKDFNITIQAEDSANHPVPNYAESASVVLDVNESKASHGCQLGSIDLSGVIFHHGVAKVLANYSDVGQLTFKVSEINGSEYAKVDAGDTSDSARYITVAKQDSPQIKPAKMHLDWSFENGDTHNGYTYYNNYDHNDPDLRSMYAQLKFEASVQNDAGQPVQNFKKGCYAEDIPISIDYTIESEDRNPNFQMNASYQDQNGTYHTDLDKLGQSFTVGANQVKHYKLDKILFENGHAVKMMAFNFKRDASRVREPMQFTINEVNATLGDIDERKTDTKKATFLYARAFIPDQTIVGHDLNAKVYFEVYCKDCNRTKYGLEDLQEDEDAVYWYKLPSIAENVFDFEDPATINSVHNPASTISARSRYFLEKVEKISGKKVHVKVSKSPMIVRIKYKPKAYLRYNPFNASVETQSFTANFLPKVKNWAGKGDLGFTVDTNLNPRNNFDIIDW